MERVLDEGGENGNMEDGKRIFDQEDFSGTDTDSDELQYGARRKKINKGVQKNSKLYGEKSQSRGKVLIFSSSLNHENGRGRGRDHVRGRGRGVRSSTADDHEDGAGYSKKHFRSKGYDKSHDSGENFSSEDGRIGRQLRLLSRETDEDVICKICQQLQEAFLLQDNLRYVRYNLISIGNSLLETYKLVNGNQARKTVSVTISRLGFVTDHDFNSFAKWILSSYQKEGNEKVCCSIMDALTEMIKLNEKSPRLKNVDTLLLPGLQTALESADTPDLFESTLNPVLLIAVKNPTTFLPYFRDTVDILVGWFVDPAQPAKVIRSATRALHILHPFWKEDLPFSKTLLSQFLEDLDAYVAETNALLLTPEEETLAVSLKKIASLLNVFVVVGAQVCLLPETAIYSSGFLNNALSKVSLCAIELLRQVGSRNESEEEGNALSDVIQFANDCISLLVRWLGSRVTSEAVKPCLDLLSDEMKTAKNYEFPLMVSMLQLMTCLTEQHIVASQLPLETIQQWMVISNWLICSTRNREVLSHVARLLRAVIKVKNVSLLIEVYRSLAVDLDRCFTSLRENKNAKAYMLSETEENALLLLSPLADLGRSSSLVGMWALDPSLLELLASKFRPFDQIRFLSINHPTLFLGILRVLHGHAKSHSHFVANSCLLMNAASGNKNLHGCVSPTSGNLSLILTLLTDLCLELSRTSTCESSKILLLQWSGQLLETCKPCTSQLNQSELFQHFLASVVKFCDSTSAHQPFAVESVISCLLDLPDITKKSDLATQIAIICIHQLRNESRTSNFLHLLGRFPSQILQEAIRCTKSSLLSSVSLASWIQNESTIATRSSQQFFDFVLKGVPVVSYESLHSFYMGGCKTNNFTPVNCDLPLWLAVQSALLCVNSKLRTPLGKPQDTFLAIEDAIKSAAGRPSGQESVTEQSLAQLSRVSLLLSFYEMLEKFMFNAFDGCSVALPLAPKAIRVFFRTNQTTCQEWVNRMASAALTLSVRTGRYASAARFGLNLLTHWTQTRRTIEPADLENVLQQVVLSLIKLGASQQIKGLKSWAMSPAQADFFQHVNLNFLEAAAFQADSRFEDAIESYVSMGDQPSAFVGNQIVESYMALSDWENFIKWKNQSADWLGNTAQLNKQIADLTESFDHNAHLQWPEKPSPAVEVQWSVDHLLNEVKSGLLMAADRIRASRSVYMAPASSWKIVEYLMRSNLELSHLSGDDKLTSLLPLAHALSHKNESAYVWMEHTHSVLKCASSTALQFSTSSVGVEWSRWLHWYATLDRQATDIAVACTDVDLSIVSQARVEGNLHLAERQLLRSMSNTQTPGQSHDLPTQLMNEALKMKLTCSTSARLEIQRQFEGAKLLHRKGETEAAISVLTQCSLALCRSLQSTQCIVDTILPHMAESYILLAKWLQQSLQSSTHLKNIATLKELANAESHNQEDHADIVSKLMERASQFCPASSEAWLAWGHYQYSGAQQKTNIKTLLTTVLPLEDATRLANNIDELTDDAEQVLTTDPALTKKPMVLKRILSELQSSRTLGVEGYIGALKAFFEYLYLRGSSDCQTHRRHTVDVALRMLRIFSRHLADVDVELSKLLSSAVKRTPSGAWRSITPQLLSLLQHGKPWLRNLVRQILGQLASDWPQLLVFPVAVGAAGLAWSWSTDPFDVNETSNAEDVSRLDAEDLCPANKLQNVYEGMMNEMNTQVPEMVHDVRLLLTELRRLVLLWDELWVAVLQQVHPQVEQLLQKFQIQSQKLDRKNGLDEEDKKQLLQKHFLVLFKPILLLLDAVAEITNVAPETPHETWFSQRYSKILTDGIQNFWAGCNSGKSVHELWRPFKHVLLQLQHINCRRSLKLDDVSPALKQMKNTKIPMPGVNGNKQVSTLFITSVDNVVIVLPTKTKPKKFVFLGSDGKRYAYLFKGMEDLHLDQRIMQVLSLSNILLSESKHRYRARHYGVIPLGPRSGLIQWVEGVTPLFSLYKRWLQRQAANANHGNKGEWDTTAAAVPRPSELFYNKLTPLLEAEGLSAHPRQRNQWPTEILRKVLDELMEETPKDLVSRELWAGSLNTEQWWSSTACFGQSCAMMSVIGYAIGLGDRHLDNVLVDLRCGEVVHIDYNVCFEKGRQLRVPENVPFRMTANIQHALGVAGTGLQGTFRMSCIDVMKMMRENRELFEILLEHFVYDPLIDWRSPHPSTSHESNLIPLYVVNPTLAARCSRDKRVAEADATFKLFELRMSELGPDWSTNHEEMIAILSSLSSVTISLSVIHSEIERLQGEIQDLHQDRLVLFNVRSDKNHIMRQPEQLSAILLPLRTAWEGERSVRVALRAFIEDNAKWAQLYVMAFSSLNSGQLKRWAEEIGPTASSDGEFETGFSVVFDFLNSSGQPALAHQGQILEQQVRSYRECQNVQATVVVNLLGTYAALAVHYPPNKLELHRNQLLSLWAKELEENLSTETCQRLAAAFQDNFNVESPVLLAKQQLTVDFNLSLRRLFNEASLRVHQASLQLTEDPSLNGSDGLEESKDALSKFNTIHGKELVNYAALESMYQVYKEIETVQQESTESFDNVLIACNQACRTTELLLDMDSVDQVVLSDATALKLLDQLFQDLQEFIFNGTTVVLPELIRLFEHSDPSIIQLHEELEALCIDINHTKMEVTRLRFQDLLGEGNDEEVQLTRGQMLLLCLNGLFEKIETNLVKLANHLRCVPALKSQGELLEDAWNRMQAELVDNLEDTLMAKRLMLMISVFQSCSDWAEGFQTGQISRELQQDSFVDKFQRMASAWMMQFISGATSFCFMRLCVQLSSQANQNDVCSSLEDLIELKRNSMKSVHTNEELLDQACELFYALVAHWQKNEQKKLARQRLEVDQCLVQLLQQQLTAHSWLHDTNTGINSACGLFILNLRQALSVLLSQSPQLTELHQQITNLASQVEQRLKWAVGANSSLHKIMEKFAELHNACLLRLQTFSSLTTALGSVCSAILHYESFRTKTPEALAADTTFIQLLSQCQDICLLKDCGANGRLTEAEVRLAQRITIGEDGATDDWINQTEKSITDKISTSKQQLADLVSKQTAHVDNVHQMNSMMRSHLAVHHQLISDVRSVLKVMAKCEAENGPVSQYLDKYRQFSECCSSVSRHLAAKEYDSNRITEIQKEIDILQNTTSEIYHGLNQLCGALCQPIATPKKSNEVNATAVSIWHRVRLKLEGRDPDPNKLLTVEEQVDAIIDEATSLENLALLYEGWTPWV